MDYQEILQRVRDLDFIGDANTADAAVKAVLGILVSSMDETQARKLTDRLPEPLTLERLRGHQARVEKISMSTYIAEIGTQFKLNPEQAETLVNTVFHVTKEAVGDEVFAELEGVMPADWASVMQKA